MIATAVRPIASPMTNRMGIAPVNHIWTEDIGCPRIAAKEHAETMNAPRHPASIRYSGQCFCSASSTIFLALASNGARVERSITGGSFRHRHTARSFFAPRDIRRLDLQELYEVFREHEIERPIERNAHFLLETGQLAQVNRAPEPPGDEPGEVDTEDVGDACPTADRSELTDRREDERLPVSASNCGH